MNTNIIRENFEKPQKTSKYTPKVYEEWDGKRGKSKYTIGYTAGVFDLFHIGHLNILRNAKSLCDKLVVGVTTDELANYKNKKAVIPFEERIEIVRNIKHVDVAVPQIDMDKFAAWKKLKFDIMFVGDDWFNTEKWRAYDITFKQVGVKIIYLPYTKCTTSTLLTETLINLTK